MRSKSISDDLEHSERISNTANANEKGPLILTEGHTDYPARTREIAEIGNENQALGVHGGVITDPLLEELLEIWMALDGSAREKLFSAAKFLAQPEPRMRNSYC